ncbi:MAG: triose-phosphate isomerase [Culturomica sp.]|jgi:triosephosphate isomerase|nr:triose-phosphate isomerase [Culturomica sp.]
MLKKKIVAGNWKMNTTLPEGIALAKAVNEKINALQPKDVGVIIAPPFTHLSEVKKVIGDEQSLIAMASQNCAAETKGAYTGEVSAAMVVSVGCTYTILGHSERRSYYGDTNEILTKKVAQALENNLNIIFCVGESLSEREAAKHFEVVQSQLENVLFKLPQQQFANIVIAYEPVWAIGTGKTATADQAQEMHAFIRSAVKSKFGADIAKDVVILYGGSCTPQNAGELFAKQDVDGGLIGGAALKADDFVKIVEISMNTIK